MSNIYVRTFGESSFSGKFTCFVFPAMANVCRESFNVHIPVTFIIYGYCKSLDFSNIWNQMDHNKVEGIRTILQVAEVLGNIDQK